ncbi:MAG: serine hydrolase domain-containing protein [Woeseiaceae bacterium]|nr:serine hydrolase domain-containing protein [Woeseiaceae bacterium]
MTRSMIGMALLCVCAPWTWAEPLSADDPRIKAFETGLIDRMQRGNPGTQRWTIEQRLENYRVPGVAVAILDGGEIVWAKGYGVTLAGSDDAVDADTVFSVGSVSKMINAALILRLVAEGRLDLDKDVNEYLTSWQVPESRYSRQEKVTLRRILSHTAGFTVHGFADYEPDEALPTALQTLNGQRPAKNDRVELMFAPGDRMDYSGGGITVSQVLVEDVTGLAYEDAARKYVFEPLGMARSTFANPLPVEHGNIARAHDDRGRPAGLPRGWEAMPELAASGLWTSANDLGAFVIGLLDDGFLPPGVLEDMMNREERSWYGLGPRLNGNGPSRVFHHGGANNSYRAWIEGHPDSGAGIVVVTNGTDGHWIHAEVRKSAEDAFGWPVKSDGGFEEPDFQAAFVRPYRQAR